MKLGAPLLIRQIKGHSMLPALPPNTIVWGWCWFLRLRPGHVVVITHDGKEKVKRIQKLEGERVFLVGDHPEASTDSRHFGWLPRTVVRARVIWPRASATREFIDA